MQSRSLKLYAKHEHVKTTDTNGARNMQATTAGVRSQLVAFEPPVGTWYGVARYARPILKLYASNGAAIPGDTLVFVGKKRAGDSSPTFAPGAFDLFSFSDLSTAEQRSRDNDANLTVDLGAVLNLRESEQLVVYLEGSVAVDPTQSGTTFELPVQYGTL